MKKTIICTVALFIATVSISTAKPTGLNIGGGIATNSLTNIDVNEVPTTVGPQLEVGYDIYIARNFNIYTGLRFSEKFGYGNYTNVEERTRMSDIMLPIMFQYNFVINPNAIIYLEAGPSLDIVAAWKSTLKSKESGESGEYDRMKDGQYNMINVFIGGNIGVKIHQHVKIFAGADYDLVKFNKEDSDIDRIICKLGAAYVF